MIYYFNPDTEMALREGESSFYIAPAAVRQMAHDLALLPLWLGDEGDAVLVEEMPPSGFLEQLHTLVPSLSLPAIVTPPQLNPGIPFTPWGWNPTLFAKLRHWGVSYPDEEAMAPLRYALGNKANLQQLDHELMSRGLRSASERHFAIHSADEAETLLTREAWLFSHGFLLKEGYSSSGRGHRWCRLASPPLPAELRQWIQRRTERGESIDMEPLYNKVADLALLFHLNPGSQASFSGYSLFETTPEGAYRSNLLASNEAILSHLGQLIDTALITEVRQTFQRLFEERYPQLSGPIGIDMMIYREASSGLLSLHPNVEVNPRPSMGLLARRLYDRLLAPYAPDHLLPSTAWRFVIEGSASAAQLQQRHALDQQLHPLQRDAHGHLTSGYLPLIPITPKNRFRAYIIR